MRPSVFWCLMFTVAAALNALSLHLMNSWRSMYENEVALSNRAASSANQCWDDEVKSGRLLNVCAKTLSECDAALGDAKDTLERCMRR